MQTKFDQSFGIIPVRKSEGVWKFLLVQHGSGHWDFPKGHAEVGESPIQAAKRELCEETGITQVEIKEYIVDSEEYWFVADGMKYHKKVEFFLGIVKKPEIKLQESEVKDAKWVDYEKALESATYKNAKQMLMRTHEKLLNLVDFNG